MEKLGRGDLGYRSHFLLILHGFSYPSLYDLFTAELVNNYSKKFLLFNFLPITGCPKEKLSLGKSNSVIFYQNKIAKICKNL